MKKPKTPTADSVIHGIAVAKAHAADVRFTGPRSEAASAARGGKKSYWVACECDLCVTVRRWMLAREKASTAARPRGAG